MPSHTVEQLAQALAAEQELNASQENDLADLKARVARLEGLTEVVTAVRADMATIAEGVDPRLAEHVAELESTVENHGLLLARLLDNE